MGKVRHLGIIPDGGGRWANREKLSLADGYRVSMGKILAIAEAFFNHGGQEMSVYLFSIDNFKRLNWEIDALMDVAAEFIKDLEDRRPSLGFSASHVGRLDLLRPDVQQAIRSMLSADRSGAVMNILLGYDYWDELREAVRSGTLTGEQPLFNGFAVPTSVDLVIRTGGARTLSKFLPLQTAHARLIFWDDLFNDLSVEDFLATIVEHEELDLKFGN